MSESSNQSSDSQLRYQAQSNARKVLRGIRDRGVWFNDLSESTGWTWGDPDSYCADRNYANFDDAKRAFHAFCTGMEDGILEPEELSMGMTYPESSLNELYDKGVNTGQELVKRALGN
jgi:hypothetical protein